MHVWEVRLEYEKQKKLYVFLFTFLLCKEFAYTRINESYILDEPHWWKES